MLSHDRLQLMLPLPHQPRYDACDFVPAVSNLDALAWLETDWPDRRLALFGPAGCGKSHFLHLWAERVNAVVLAGQSLADLDTMPQHGAMALDDGDTVADQALLLHLLNTARDRGLHLLMSGRTAPSRWAVQLPDLSSRLRAMAATEIRTPDDELCATLLMRLLADRQLTMAPAVRDWVLRRLPRSPAVLREVVARLDRASLMYRSAITRPLAARVLSEGEFDVEDPDEILTSDVGHSSRTPSFL